MSDTRINESKSSLLAKTAKLFVSIPTDNSIPPKRSDIVAVASAMNKTRSAAPALPQESQTPDSEKTIDPLPYFSPESLDQIASIISSPVLPAPSDPNSPFGSIRIKVYISEDGIADRIEVLESSIAEDYASVLIEVFEQAQFTPGILDGKAIKSWRIVEVDYSPS